MSSVSLNKSVEDVAVPAIEQAVGPNVEPKNNVAPVSSKFNRMQQKFFPITRKLITGSWNGDLGHLSTAKKVLTLVVGSLLSIISSIFTVPFVVLKRAQIKVFNALPVAEKAGKTILHDVNQVIDSAIAYKNSPDNHNRKVELAKKIHTLGVSLDKIKFEFPEQALRAEKNVREMIQAELGDLEIAIKPQSSQDMHRFTLPLANLVLDGFFPMINGAPNPLMKGVSAESVTYQFEEGLFSGSKDRLIDSFFQQSEVSAPKAYNDLMSDLKNVVRPTKQAADKFRETVLREIGQKLSNPNDPKFQKFAEAARRQLDQGQLEMNEIQAVDLGINNQQLQDLSSSLVSSNILSQGQADVFLATVKGDVKTSTLFEVEAETKKHDQTANKTAKAVAAVVGIMAAAKGAAMVAAKFAPNLLVALPFTGPQAAIAGGLAIAGATVYALSHKYKAATGPKMTPGQEAARSFASAVSTQRAAVEKVIDVEYQAIEAGVHEEVSALEIEGCKQALKEADAVREQAGEAIEVMGRNPSPTMIERARAISAKAHQKYEQVKLKAEALEAKVKAAIASPKPSAPSYIDLEGRFRAANKAMKQIDTGLDGAQGVSNRGGKSIDELQRGLQKKVKALAAFESVNLDKVRTLVATVETLEQEIQGVLVAQKAKPDRATAWEASLKILHQDLDCRKARIKEINDKHDLMKKEIAQLREMISIMGSAPAA